MRHLFLISAALLIAHVAWTQTNTRTALTVEGVIVDSKTGEGVPFANIRVANSAMGTASNEQGAFIFKFLAAQQDTLIITCIGYITARIPVRLFNIGRTIYLRQAATELPELTVHSQSGLSLLKEVIARIPENYDTTTVGYTAFYQENVWLGDAELTFIEAVLNIYRPFKTSQKPNDQISILKGRKKQLDYSADPQLYHWLNGTSNGPRGCLAEDLVKYHQAKYSPFNPVNYKYYHYEHTETITTDENRLLVLDIYPIRRSNKSLVKMRLYIDESSLAIAKYTLELTPEGIQKTSRKDKHIGYQIMSRVVHASLEYHQFQYTFSYQEHHGKWYLDRISRHWEILVDSKRRGWDDHLWRSDANLIITDLDTRPSPIAEGNIGASEASLVTLMGNNFEDDFWGDFNFIKSDDTPPIKLEIKSSPTDTVQRAKNYSNRQNGFTRADTLRGKLTPLRSCYDVTFYHLDVVIDVDRHFIEGSNTIRFNAEEPFERMQVDLHTNMTIDKIMYHEQELTYSREFNAVYVNFPKQLERGAKESIRIFYHGTPKVPDLSIPMDGGALWERDSLGNIWAQMVCQGSGASVWWPNKDHLSDEPDSMKIWITVPADYTEISNGRLMRKVKLAGNQTRFEWEVGYPINNYNVTYNIGKYKHWSKKFIGGDTVLLNFYAMPYHEKAARDIFNTVPEMLTVFEANYGKYPFSRDGFTLIESVYPMEHQSAVCIGTLTNTLVEANRLMWHESAHEWWGNAVSCKDMADLWIHEAFATYAEIAMIEAKYGKMEISALLSEELNAVRGEEPMIGVYDVNHIHYDIGDMYSKGSLMLHTLRTIINNDKQWKGLLQSIQDHFRFKTVTTEELIAHVNAYMKKDFNWFFQQYLYETNLPTLKLSIEERESSLLVKYKWDAGVENFNMPARITKRMGQFGWIYPSSRWQTVTLKDMTMDNFEVDEENFLINVEYDVN